MIVQVRIEYKGQGRCQGMVYGMQNEPEEQTEEYEYYYGEPYYGFPIE